MEISTQEIINLSDVCRACLMRTDNMKNLLDPNPEVIQLISTLASVSNLEIEINESCPCFLCSNCEEKLKISHEFQQLVQKSHQLILACLSATGALKPLKSVDSLIKSDILPQAGSTRSGFINFIDTDNLHTEIQVCYKDSVANMPITENTNYLQDELSAEQIDCPGVVDELSIAKEPFLETIQTDNCLSENEVSVAEPSEVEKRTANNQTMRLAQYSVEEVDKLIKKARERFFKRANCLFCGFTASYTRSLSAHMTRLHREFKEQWCAGCNEIVDNLKEHQRIVHKDDFKCSLCGKISTSTGHFLEHLASHSIERKYICKTCKKCFISERHLKKHYQRVHTSDKKYTCNICSKGFLSTISLKLHSMSHIQKFNCEDCKEIFAAVEEYEAHKCIIGKAKPLRNGFCTEVEGDVFFYAKIERPQNFCNECNKKVRSLTKHNEKFHSVIERNRDSDQGALCTYCGKQCKSLAQLNVHVRMHTGETPYKCSYCDKRTSTRYHLVVHERIHTGEKPHICSVCGKSFSQSSVLNTHMKLHTGRPEQCIICLKRFCRKSELRQHMRRHTGENPYICSHCGQGFKQKSHLVGHTKTHSSERPYQCEFCEKNFKLSGSLKSHINRHLEKKLYKCSQCTYTCRQGYKLTQHMVQHENDDLNAPSEPYDCEISDPSLTTQAMFSSHCIRKHNSVNENYLPESNLPKEELEIKDEAILQSLNRFS